MSNILNENDKKEKQYYVQMPTGERMIVPEADFLAGRDKFFKDYPDAKVQSMHDYTKDDDYSNVQEGTQFTVQMPTGENMIVPSKDFIEGKDRFFADFPGAKVSAVNDERYNYFLGQATQLGKAVDDFFADEERGGYMAAHKDEYDNLMQNMSGIRGALPQETVQMMQRYHDLDNERKELQRAYHSNPVVKESDEFFVKNNRHMYEQYMDMADKATSREERLNYKRAAKFHDEAATLYGAPSDSDNSNGFVNYLRGMGDTFNDRDFWSAGITEIARNFDLRRVHKKLQEAGKNLKELTAEDIDSILTESEAAEIRAFAQLAYSQERRANDLSRGYQIGQGTAESLGYMAQFMASGSITKGAGAVLSSSEKAWAKWLGRELMTSILDTDAILLRTADMSKAGAATYKYVSKPITEAFTHTLLQPATLKSVSEEMMKVQDNGELVGVGGAIVRGFGDALIENWSESMGTAVEDFLGLVVGKPSTWTLNKIGLADYAKRISESGLYKIMREAGWNGFVGEMGEEWVGNAARVATGLMTGDEFEDFASLKSQIDMAASFGLMSAIGLGNTSYKVMQERKKHASDMARMQAILHRNGVSKDEIQALFGKKFQTADELSNALVPYAHAILNSGNENAREEYKELLKYAESLSKTTIIDGVDKLVKDGERQKVWDELNQQTGGQYMYMPVDSEQGVIRTIDVTNPKNGKTTRGYVVSVHDDGSIGIVREDGSRAFMTNDQLAEGTANGTIVDSGNKTANEFADEVIEQRKKESERQRMIADEQKQRNDVQSRLVPGADINLGTVEEPKLGKIVQPSPNGYMVQMSDGTVQEISLDTAASAIGTPINVMTDEQMDVAESSHQDDLEKQRKAVNNAAGITFQYNGAKYNLTNAVRWTTDENGQLALMVGATDEIGWPTTIFLDSNTVSNILADNDRINEIEGAEEEEKAADNIEVPVQAEDDGRPRDVNGNLIPLKADGSVDKAEFWNKYPEGWAVWNDKQRGDKGENSKAYIAKAIEKLNGDIKAIGKKIAKELDFDALDELENEKDQVQQRINKLQAIIESYNPKPKVKQTELEMPASNIDTEAESSDLGLDELDEQLGEPDSWQEYVTRSLPSYKFVWANNTNGTRGLGSHTISDSEEERMKRISWLANRDKGGLYPEEVAENIYNDMPEGLKQTTNVADILDHIIDDVLSNNSPGAAIRRIYDSKQDAMRSYELYLERRDEMLKDEFAQAYGFESWDEYEIFEEVVSETFTEIPNNKINEYYNSIYGSENNAEQESAVPGVVESAGKQTDGNGTGTELGITAETDNTGGTESEGQESTAPRSADVVAESAEQVSTQRTRRSFAKGNESDDVNSKFEKEKSSFESQVSYNEYAKALAGADNIREAISNILSVIPGYAKEYLDWASRVYKKNGNTVIAGGKYGELEGTETTIGSANERRRMNTLKGLADSAKEREGWVKILLGRCGVSENDASSYYPDGYKTFDELISVSNTQTGEQEKKADDSAGTPAQAVNDNYEIHAYRHAYEVLKIEEKSYPEIFKLIRENEIEKETQERQIKALKRNRQDRKHYPSLWSQAERVLKNANGFLKALYEVRSSKLNEYINEQIKNYDLSNFYALHPDFKTKQLDGYEKNDAQRIREDMIADLRMRFLVNPEQDANLPIWTIRKIDEYLSQQKQSNNNKKAELDAFGEYVNTINIEDAWFPKAADGKVEKKQKGGKHANAASATAVIVDNDLFVKTTGLNNKEFAVRNANQYGANDIIARIDDGIGVSKDQARLIGDAVLEVYNNNGWDINSHFNYNQNAGLRPAFKEKSDNADKKPAKPTQDDFKLVGNTGDRFATHKYGSSPQLFVIDRIDYDRVVISIVDDKGKFVRTEIIPTVELADDIRKHVTWSHPITRDVVDEDYDLVRDYGATFKTPDGYVVNSNYKTRININNEHKQITIEKYKASGAKDGFYTMDVTKMADAIKSGEWTYMGDNVEIPKNVKPSKPKSKTDSSNEDEVSKEDRKTFASFKFKIGSTVLYNGKEYHVEGQYIPAGTNDHGYKLKDDGNKIVIPLESELTLVSEPAPKEDVDASNEALMPMIDEFGYDESVLNLMTAKEKKNIAKLYDQYNVTGESEKLEELMEEYSNRDEKPAEKGDKSKPSNPSKPSKRERKSAPKEIYKNYVEILSGSKTDSGRSGVRIDIYTNGDKFAYVSQVNPDKTNWDSAQDDIYSDYIYDSVSEAVYAGIKASKEEISRQKAENPKYVYSFAEDNIREFEDLMKVREEVLNDKSTLRTKAISGDSSTRREEQMFLDLVHGNTESLWTQDDENWVTINGTITDEGSLSERRNRAEESRVQRVGTYAANDKLTDEELSLALNAAEEYAKKYDKDSFEGKAYVELIESIKNTIEKREKTRAAFKAFDDGLAALPANLKLEKKIDSKSYKLIHQLTEDIHNAIDEWDGWYRAEIPNRPWATTKDYELARLIKKYPKELWQYIFVMPRTHLPYMIKQGMSDAGLGITEESYEKAYRLKGKDVYVIKAEPSGKHLALDYKNVAVAKAWGKWFVNDSDWVSLNWGNYFDKKSEALRFMANRYKKSVGNKDSKAEEAMYYKLINVEIPKALREENGDTTPPSGFDPNEDTSNATQLNLFGTPAEKGADKAKENITNRAKNGKPKANKTNVAKARVSDAVDKANGTLDGGLFGDIVTSATEATNEPGTNEIIDALEEYNSKPVTAESKEELVENIKDAITTKDDNSYGADNKVVSKDRYEELKRRMKGKLGQLNVGFDPEMFAIGTEMAAYHIEAGARKFVDFAKRMITDMGDEIRPWLKSFYKGARMLPGMEEFKEMTNTDAEVDAIDVDNFDKVEETTVDTTEEKPTSKYNVGDEVTYTAKDGRTYNVKIVEVNNNGTYNVEYNPSGFLPAMLMGVSDEDFNKEDASLGYNEYYKKFYDEFHKKATELDSMPKAKNLEKAIKAREESLVMYGDMIKSGAKVEKGGVDPYLSIAKAQAEIDVLDEMLKGTFSPDKKNYAVKVNEQEQKPTIKEDVRKDVIDSALADADNAEPDNAPVGTVVADTNTKTGEDIWVVKLGGTRLSKDAFAELKSKAKENGGYYSSFKKGFLFKSEEDANNFNNTNSIEHDDKTDIATATDTAVAVRTAASVAEQAETVAEKDDATEEEINNAIGDIEEELDNVNNQLIVLGEKMAFDTNEQADEAASNLVSSIVIDLGQRNVATFHNSNKDFIDVKCLTTKSNSFRVTGYVREKDGRTKISEIYLTISKGSGKGLKVLGTISVDNKSYSDILAESSRITGFKNLLEETWDNVLDTANKIAEKNNDKRENNVPLNGDGILGELKAPTQKKKGPDHHGYEKGDEVIYNYPGRKPKKAKIVDFDEYGRPVLDTFGASWISEIADWEYVEPKYKKNDEGTGDDSKSVREEVSGRGPVEQMGSDEASADGGIQTEGNGGTSPKRTSGGKSRADKGDVLGEGVGVDKGRTLQPLRDSGSSETRTTGGISEQSAGDRRLDNGSPKTAKEKNNPLNTRNFLYPDDYTSLEYMTPEQRFEANVQALETLAVLIREEREATPEEKLVLSRLRGWGGVRIPSEYEMRDDWRLSKLQKRFKAAINELDGDKKIGVYKAIETASLTAYYTPLPIAKSINKAIEAFGYKGKGIMLDPSMGNGIFEGTMTKGVQQSTQIHGCELDWLTGQIARRLYPDANVKINGFESSDIPVNYYDVVTSNIPFGAFRVTDLSWEGNMTPVRRTASNMIHNYFAVKMIESTKPGGLCVIMTSKATMDTTGNAIIRDYITKECEVLGALRLPSEVFKGAGTTPVTDILFLRKFRDIDDRNDTLANEDYRRDIMDPFNSSATAMLKDENGNEHEIKYNSYYEKHTGFVIGEPYAGGQYKKDSFGVTSKMSNEEIAESIIGNARLIASKYRKDRGVDAYSKVSPRANIVEAIRESYVGNGDYAGSGNIAVQNGKVGMLVKSSDDKYSKQFLFDESTTIKDVKKAEAYIALRTDLKKLISSQIAGNSDAIVDGLRKNLQGHYNYFVQRYGKLNDKKNIFILEDIDGYQVAALENYKDGKFVGLADIFTKNTIKSKRDIYNVTDEKDAINNSLSEFGGINAEYLEKVLGENWEELCGDMVYRDPENIGTYLSAEAYLSGDVVTKLGDARRMAKQDDAYKKNVKALEGVQPRRKEYGEYPLHMGSQWVPAEIYSKFLVETFGIKSASRRWNADIKSGITFVEASCEWVVNIDREELGGESESWRTSEVDAPRIFEAALKDRDITVYYPHAKDEPEIVDQVSTEAARNKTAELREHFEDWVAQSPERVKLLTDLYNNRFNRTHLIEWNGQHLNVQGLQGKELRPHQKDAVWMLLNNKGGIIDHMVGAGKTLVMQSAIMEMRRMGIARKPMIIALKSTVQQIAKEFREAFPYARVLAPNDGDFAKAKRKKFISNITMNDYDCVIISHEQYCMLDHTDDVKGEIMSEKLMQLDSLIEYLYSAENMDALTKRQLKALQKRRENLRAKLTAMQNKASDNEFTFENLGVDMLFVDECQAFKNLAYSTSYSRIAGLGPQDGSSKSLALLHGIRYLQSMRHGDMGTVFLSGTTITNSLTELYNIFNYLRPNEMNRMGLNTFDAWASSFAIRSSEAEFGVTNELREKVRFRRFEGLQELSRIYKEIADVRNDSNLELPKPKMNVHLETIPISDTMREINAEIVNMVQRKDGRYFGITPVEIGGRDLTPWSLHATNLAKKATLSPKLIDVKYKDEGGKVNKCCENIKMMYDKFNEQKGTQLIFCDGGVPGDGKEFDVYTDIINRLVNTYGIPREEIADIHVADTEEKRKALFNNVRAGKVRILIGGTKNMGTGVNVQDRIVALHHMDIPWTPSDVDQRNGRGARQGNLIARDFNDNKVEVFYYAVERTLDTYRYQLQDTKGRMINAFKTANADLDTFDEGSDGGSESGSAMDPAEMVALLSGNPIILDKAKQDKKVDKLRKQRRGWEQDMANRQNTIKYLEHHINAMEGFVSGNKSDIQILKNGGFAPNEENEFPAMKVRVTDRNNIGRSVEFDKAKEAGETIRKEMKKGTSLVLSSYGVSAYIEKDNIWDTKYIKLDLPSGIEYKTDVSDDDVALGMSMQNLLKKVYHNQVAYKRELDDSKEKLSNMPAVEKTWPKESELTQALLEKERIDEEYSSLIVSDEPANRNTNNEHERIIDAETDTPKFDMTDSLAVAEAMSAVRKLADKLGVPVKWVEGTGRKGAYREGSKSVEIDLANAESIDDVIETYLHESVAHFGLRKLLGNDFNKFIDAVYNNGSGYIREKIESLMADNNWDRAYATEEYIAELAQKTDYNKPEMSFWRKVKAMVVRIIEKLVGEEDSEIEISEELIKDLLVSSYKNLENAENGEFSKASSHDLLLNLYNDNTLDYERVNELVRRITQENTRLTVLPVSAEKWVATPAQVGGRLIAGAIRRSNETSLPQTREGVVYNEDLANIINANIISWAESEGHWFDSEDITENYNFEPVREWSAESQVFIDSENKRVIKLMSAYTYGGDLGYLLDSITMFNDAFPGTAYNVIGFSENENGDPCLVVIQNQAIGDSIDDIEPDDTLESHHAMMRDAYESLGASGYDEYAYNFSIDDYYVHDAHGGNIILVDGEGYVVIDANVYLAEDSWYRKNGNFDVEDYHVYEHEGPVHERILNDKRTLDYLNGLKDDELMPVVRSMQIIENDGKRFLVPPMSGKVNGEWQDPIEIDENNNIINKKMWIGSDERPDMLSLTVPTASGKSTTHVPISNCKLNENGEWMYKNLKTGEWEIAPNQQPVFYLDKTGKPKDAIWAAYNPYGHYAIGMLNDQFSQAQDRDNLVSVRFLIPKSELNGEYKAQYAKDATGEIPNWKAGVITSQLTGTRGVILSRWGKPVGIVPNSEVADDIYNSVNGKDIIFPSNVVPKEVRKHLEAKGVKFVETDNQGHLKEGKHKGDHYSMWYAINPSSDNIKKWTKRTGLTWNEMEKERNAMRKEVLGETNYTTGKPATITAYHGTVGEYSYEGGIQWLSPDRNVAKGYAEYNSNESGFKPVVKKRTVSLNNPLVIDAEGATWGEIPTSFEVYSAKDNYDESFKTRAEADAEAKKHSDVQISVDGTNDTNELAERAKKEGYDGLIITNVVDVTGSADVPGTSIAIFSEDAFDNGREHKGWHGTSYDFDSFDNSHIGEGEGSQVHGWGTYIAFDPKTSKKYAESTGIERRYITKYKGLSHEELIDKLVKESGGRRVELEVARELIERYNRDGADFNGQRNFMLWHNELGIKGAKSTISDNTRLAEKTTSEKQRAKYLKAVEHGEKRLEVENKRKNAILALNGSDFTYDRPSFLYEVEIPEDNGDNYIYEDKPLPERAAKAFREDYVNTFGEDATREEWDNNLENSPYKVVRETLAEGEPEIEKMLSERLNSLGYVGIKYTGSIDGDCAVIFNDKDVIITDQTRFRIGMSANGRQKVDFSFLDMKNAALDTAKKLGVEVNVVTKDDMPAGHANAAGLWKNGTIYVCPDNCLGVNDAMRTVIHEAVGHEGISRLVGKDLMRDFCMFVYRNLSPEDRREIINMAKEDYDWNIQKAIEEFLAYKSEHLSFDDSFTPSIWQKIRDAFRILIDKIGIYVPIDDDDLRYIFWQSRQALKKQTPISMARTMALANRLGKHPAQRKLLQEAATKERKAHADGIMSDNAARLYNNSVAEVSARMKEVWIDKDDSVVKLVESVEKSTGSKAKAFEDVRLALNQQSSKGLEAITKWTRNNWEPLRKVVNDICEKTNLSIEDVERYMMIKHGIERNDVFAKRDAKAMYKAQYDAAMDAIDKSDLTEMEKDIKRAKAEARLEKFYKAIENGTDPIYKNLREQDYGGLTGIYSEYDEDFDGERGADESEEEFNARLLAARQPMFETIAETEAQAAEDVAEVESKLGDYLTEELWKAINNATRSTLKMQYEYNMLSKEQYNNLLDMFDYYVPLRGFNDKTAEDLYSYYTENHGNGFVNPIIAAKGRKSQATSPLGYIGAAASSAVAQGEKNNTKLALYYFGSNRPENNILKISEAWYKKLVDENGEPIRDDRGRIVFNAVYPPLNDALTSEEARDAYDAWENGMKRLAKEGLAFKGTKKLDLNRSVIHIDENDKNSHIIKFKVMGKDMMMYVNGNPRAAQAINNELNVELSGDYQKVFGKILRYFSGINTSFNPEFWVSNIQRDLLFALMSTSVKENKEYNTAFRKNLSQALEVIKMNNKDSRGELGDSYLERMYREFKENGGVTGFTSIKGIEEWEAEIRKARGVEKTRLEGMKGAVEWTMRFGESMEQVTRFAAYLTSREQGKDIRECIADAKELTVNFNRKGSGKSISWEEAGRLRLHGKKLNKVQQAAVVAASWIPVYGRRFIMFFNASMQGLNALYKLYEADKRKTLSFAGGFMAMGAINALVHAMMDDDDDYLDLPDYTRRTNALLGGGGFYFKWALPQEMRLFYAMGDIWANKMIGRSPDEEYMGIGEVIKSALDMLPANPTDGLTAFVPSALNPIVEVVINKDFSGSPIYRDNKYLSKEEKKRTPKYNDVFGNTGKSWVALSKMLNWISGGDYTDAGLINVNPAAMEHIFEGMTGGIGTTAEKLYRGSIGALLGAIPGETGDNIGNDFQVRNVPVLSRLMLVSDERYRNAYVNDVFKYYQSEAEHTAKRLKEYKKEGDEKKIQRLMDNGDYRIMELYNDYKGQLNALDTQIRNASNDDERKELMRQQDAVRKELIKWIQRKVK